MAGKGGDGVSGQYASVLTEIVKRLRDPALLFSVAALVLLVVLGTAGGVAWPLLSAFFGVYVIGLAAYLVMAYVRRDGPVPEQFKGIGQIYHAFGLSMRTELVSASGKRDVRIVADGEQPTYEIGERIRICFTADVDCQIELIDIGTSGAMTRLFPNAFVPDDRVKANVVHTFPGAGDRFSYVLSGPVGTERIKAVATVKRPAIAAPTSREEPFTVMSAHAKKRDIAIVADRVAAYDADGTATAYCSFQIVEPGRA